MGRHKKYGSIGVSQKDDNKLYKKLYRQVTGQLHPKWTLCKEAWGKCPFCGVVRPIKFLEHFGDIEIRSVVFGGRGKIHHNDGDQTKKSMPKVFYDKAYEKYSGNILEHCVSLLRDHYTLKEIQKLFGLSKDKDSKSSYKTDSPSNYGGLLQSDYGRDSQPIHSGSSQPSYGRDSLTNFRGSSQPSYKPSSQTAYGGEQN